MKKRWWRRYPSRAEISCDFSLGFDNAAFSDRILQLQIQPHNHTIAPRVKSVCINSLILAVKSPYFCRLFTSVMPESIEKTLTIQIQDSEEKCFMDMLKYMYNCDTLPSDFNDLLNLCIISDKFEVTFCSKTCLQLLECSFDMTIESASLLMDLPHHLLISPMFQHLVREAKHFLISYFSDYSAGFDKDAFNLLPLVGVQTLISSDNFYVDSEFEVFELVLKWSRIRYPNLEERREILQKHLFHLIRFPFMTQTQLTKHVLRCSEFETEFAYDVVVSALCFKAEKKAETPHNRDEAALLFLDKYDRLGIDKSKRRRY